MSDFLRVKVLVGPPSRWHRQKRVRKNHPDEKTITFLGVAVSVPDTDAASALGLKDSYVSKWSE